MDVRLTGCAFRIAAPDGLRITAPTGMTGTPTVQPSASHESRHPDGFRCLTHLLNEYNGAYFPIKRDALLDCLSQQIRRTLPAQRSLKTATLPALVGSIIVS
jgi:hypothetical protein